MGLREDLPLYAADLQKTPLELFSYCENAMATKRNAKVRLWNDDTVKTYHSAMAKMQACYFDSLGLCFGNLEFEHLAAAVDAYEENSRSQKLSDSTREKLKSILKSLTAFVHEKLPDYADPCWGSSWSYMSSALPHIGDKKSRKESRQQREQEIDEIVCLPRSLKIVEEIKFAHALRDRLLQQDGIAMGGLLMLYLGLRPGECCGLTWEAVQPLSQDGTVRVLYIYRALDINDRTKSSLKTKNAYRVLPIPAELDELLQKRAKYVKEQLSEIEAQNMAAFPIVNSADSFTTHCSRRRFSDTIKNLLREIRTDEQRLAYAAYLLEINGQTVREENPTTYLLRRHFTTTISSICLMDEEELQFLMGHDIRYDDVQHTDMLDVDRLLKMYQKLNRRHIFSELKTIDHIDASGMVKDIDDCQLTFNKAAFENGGEVVLDVWASCPADALTLQAEAATSSSDSMGVLAADYRPLSGTEPPAIRFDSAYHKVLESARRRSETQSKDRNETQGDRPRT